jgi:hypothetical protein
MKNEDNDEDNDEDVFVVVPFLGGILDVIDIGVLFQHVRGGLQ